MNLFVDANILVAVCNKEYPLYTYAARILSLAGTDDFRLFTSPVCLAITFYFAEKKFKQAVAKEKIELLCQHIEIAGIDKASAKKSLQNAAVKDFEDGLEYYAAEEAKCRCIITEDTSDFYFSAIEVLNCHDFYLKYMAGRKINN